MEHLDPAEIARFLRGQLSPERSAEVNRHLATCQPCAERMSESQGATEAPPEEVSYATGAAFATPARAVEPPREPAKPRWIQEGRPPDRGEQVGRYLILERVGQGGMGIVYAAWDPELGRRVAIKLLRTDKPHAEGRTVGQARLQREAQAMARLNHPHVISVYDVGTLGEGVFVAMEFVDGTTLKKWVKEKSRAWSEVLDTFLAAGRGLAGAHGAGLVHRDFKPDNVLIGKDGRVRVTDFGLAREAGEGEEQSSVTLPVGAPMDETPELAQLTQQGHAVGTLMYMSPEQRRGEAPDARADQFSFCVALYWALYGTWPFDRQRSSQRGPDSGPGSSHKGTSRPSNRSNDPRPVDPTTGAFEPPKDAKVPAFLRQAIMRGLSPEPKERFPSMEALLSRLEYRPRRMRLVAAAASLALVAGVGGYAWLAHQASQHQALLCTGAEQKLAGLWDDAVRKEISEALLATGKPEAAEVASRATQMLDDYTRGWVQASTEACRATRIRGEQTEALLSLRVVCLERRLQDVKAVTGVLSTVDAELLPKAVDTIALLPSLQGCGDVTSLSQVEPRPESPKAQEEIARISGQISRLKALIDAGRYKQGLEVGEQAVKAATALGYRPLEAEALLWHGFLKLRAGEPEVAEQHLVQSFRTALASRDDGVMTRAASTLVFAISSNMKRRDDALQWSELAKA
ncbi:protein kinase domain-containing protein, partial [Hyalangium sp.]|uniref:protein kinase domain-containing protein n=1 Tax=Hyalangium sp. TaxID=2028555 RepID=UPI002D725EB2